MGNFLQSDSGKRDGNLGLLIGAGEGLDEFKRYSVGKGGRSRLIICQGMREKGFQNDFLIRFWLSELDG